MLRTADRPTHASPSTAANPNVGVPPTASLPRSRRDPLSPASSRQSGDTLRGGLSAAAATVCTAYRAPTQSPASHTHTPGSTLRGVFSAWATTLSIALQYGVPLESLVRKFAYMRFEPYGETDNPEIPKAHSIPDYVARWLASRFLDADTQDELGVLTAEVKRRRAGKLDAGAAAPAAPLRAVPEPDPPCTQCGAGFMVRTGSCQTCSTCGHNTGCG
jgi:hypothetical protein